MLHSVAGWPLKSRAKSSEATMAAACADPVFEALGMQPMDTGVRGASASLHQMQQSALNGLSFTSYGSWPPPAWCEYAQAATAAAAATAATQFGVQSSPSQTSPDRPLVLPDFLPSDPTRSTGHTLKTDELPVVPGLGVMPPFPWPSAESQMWHMPCMELCMPANEETVGSWTPPGDSEKENIPMELNLAERTAPPSFLEPARDALKDNKAEITTSQHVLATPPPKSSFRADAPTFFPQQPKDSCADAHVSGRTNSLRLEEMLLSSCVTQTPSPCTAGFGIEKTPSCWSPVPSVPSMQTIDTPVKLSLEKSTFVTTRSQMLCMRQSISVDKNDIEPLTVALPASELDQCLGAGRISTSSEDGEDHHNSAESQQGAGAYILQLLHGQDTTELDHSNLKEQSASTLQRLHPNANKDGSMQGAALLRQLQAPSPKGEERIGNKSLPAQAQSRRRRKGTGTPSSIAASTHTRPSHTVSAAGKGASRGEIRARAAAARADDATRRN